MSIAFKRKEKSKSQPKAFDFTLVLGGMSEITDELENKLFDAGCDDALLGIQDGKLFLDFTRESDSLLKAIMSAIQAVEEAGIKGLKVVEVHPPDITIIDMVNDFLRVRKHVDFDEEFWQLLAKAGMSKPEPKK